MVLYSSSCSFRIFFVVLFVCIFNILICFYCCSCYFLFIRLIFSFLVLLVLFAFVHLTSIGGSRQSGHECHVVDITSGSFDKERHGVNPNSGAYENRPTYIMKNATDLGAHSMFWPAYREKKDDILNTSNNWMCSDFPGVITSLYRNFPCY
jgi:hypothetical protein